MQFRALNLRRSFSDSILPATKTRMDTMVLLTPKQCLNQFIELLRMTDMAYIKLLKQWDISLNAAWALEYLHLHPEGVEPAVLAENNRMLRQTITVVLNDLEKRKFIRRFPHATDRRRKLIKLTPTGKEFAAEVLEKLEQVELTSFAEMSPEERETLIRLTRKFYESVQAGANSGNSNET